MEIWNLDLNTNSSSRLIRLKLYVFYRKLNSCSAKFSFERNEKLLKTAANQIVAPKNFEFFEIYL